MSCVGDAGGPVQVEAEVLPVEEHGTTAVDPDPHAQRFPRRIECREAALRLDRGTHRGAGRGKGRQASVALDGRSLAAVAGG